MSTDGSVLSPLGIEVTGLPDEPDATVVGQLTQWLAEYGVMIVRDRPLDDDAFLAFLHRFGQPVFTVGETPVPGHPDLNVVTNAGRTAPPRSVFHVDTSYVSRPPAYTALRAVTVPAEGGQTLFTNQYRAYETLPDELRERLAGRRVRHEVTGVDPGDEQERQAEHLLFRPHPVSGRVALYLSTPQRCTAISGLPDDEALELITWLYEHSTRDDNVLRHAWRPGDLVMWDNGCVLHKADHSGVVGERTMHRGMVDGYAASHVDLVS